MYDVHKMVDANAAAKPPLGVQAAKAAPNKGGFRRALGTGLAVGAVGLGAGGYALARQNEEDEKRYRQVYAPMGPGSVYG